MSEKFDSYKNSYRSQVENSIAFIPQGWDFFVKSKISHVEKIISVHYKDTRVKLLDFGCGTGRAHIFFKNKNIQIFGTDISKELIIKAQEVNPQNSYEVYDGKMLPYQKEYFDVVVAMCVFHHIQPDKQQETLLNLKFLLKKSGILIVFEHNPYNPLTQLAVSRCEFDDDAILLSSKEMKSLFSQTQFRDISKKYILYFPFKTFLTELIENFFQFLPFGAQYYVIGKK